MDPNVTLQDMCEAIIHDMDYDAALEHANNLDNWLARGGANPKLTDGNLECLIEAVIHLTREIV
jgi:hypothetical protein